MMIVFAFDGCLFLYYNGMMLVSKRQVTVHICIIKYLSFGLAKLYIQEVFREYLKFIYSFSILRP